MSVANTSRHLQELKSAGLVEVRREGHYGYYRLADEGVYGAWSAMRALGEARLAEIDRLVGTYLTDRDSLEGGRAAAGRREGRGGARRAELARVCGTSLTDGDSVEAVRAEELLRKTREEGAVVLDVRPEEE